MFRVILKAAILVARRCDHQSTHGISCKSTSDAYKCRKHGGECCAMLNSFGALRQEVAKNSIMLELGVPRVRANFVRPRRRHDKMPLPGCFGMHAIVSTARRAVAVHVHQVVEQKKVRQRERC